MGRIILAGIAGGIAMFIWGFLSHVVLPLGEMGITPMPSEQTVVDAVKTATGEKDGLYVAPSEMAQGAATEGPMVFMVYRHSVKMSDNPADMLPQMFMEVAIDIIESLILAGLLAAMAVGFAARVGWSAAAGLMAGLATMGSYHIWYGFPAEYVGAAIVDEIICFLVAGIVIALILGRRGPAAAAA
jgi:hypothetical protein